MNISLIIPTLNRTQDLEKTLNSLLGLNTLPLETIIVDQSDGDETQKLCNSYIYSSLHISYFYTKIKSSALARNLAIDHLSSHSDIVLFLDDDVSLYSDFLKQLELFFQQHSHVLGGVANIESPIRKISVIKKLGFILLTGGVKFSEMFVTRGGFNTLPLSQSTILKHIEWAMGCGMFFRKKLFDEGFRFETRFMKYSLMEDCFLSYSIQKKYPKSLYFVPSLHMVHHETPASRIPNKARILQNIVHRFYFVQKFKKSIPAYVRTMLIFCIFDLMNYRDIRVIKWYMKGLSYVFSNKHNIIKSDFDFNGFIFS